MAVPDHIREPAAIYRRSFAMIEAETDFADLPLAMHRVARRMIHACGMTDIVGDLAFSPGAAEAGRAALIAGAPILCDAQMVRYGLIPSRFPAGNETICIIGDDEVTVAAEQASTTRSAAQVDLWGDRIGGAIVAIGNAPTALFRLLERLDEGTTPPALLVATPVGFVGAAEAKAELAADPRGTDFITLRGRRGGSAICSSAINALCGEDG